MEDFKKYIEKLNEFIGNDLSVISGMDNSNVTGTSINTLNDDNLPASTTDNALHQSGQPSPWWYRYVSGSTIPTIKEEEIIKNNNLEDLKNTFNQQGLYSKYLDIKNDLDALKNSDSNTFNDVLKIIINDLQTLNNEQTI